LVVFELNAWAHPNNAKLQDSLSDGFSAVGDKDHAKQAVLRAIDRPLGPILRFTIGEVNVSIGREDKTSTMEVNSAD